MSSNKEYFSVWTPIDLVKAGAEDSEAMTARIGGIVSTEAKDQQGERVLQSGIDWTYALEKGWFNYEHKAGPESVLGHPETIEEVMYKGEPATRVEGVLYLHKPKAREIYETAVALQKAKTSRRLGFSVEGQVLARDKDAIVKSKVLNVAITDHPVNADARLDVLKSLAKASVGYQGVSAMGGSLSALVPQSMDPQISNFAYTAMRNRPKISSRALARMLSDSFTGLSFPQALRIATGLAQSLR